MSTSTDKSRAGRARKKAAGDRAREKASGAHPTRAVFKFVDVTRAESRFDVDEKVYAGYRPLEELIGIQVKSRVQLVEFIKDGFPVTAFERFSNTLGISERELGAHTGVPPRTLARRKATGHLEPDESDRVARIAMLVEEALDLFDGNQAKAAHWFKTPKRALGGATPLEYAGTEPGAQEVRSLIGRLQHGVIA